MTLRHHPTDCECRRCVMDREFLFEMAQPANHTFDVGDLDDQDQQPLSVTVAGVDVGRDGEPVITTRPAVDLARDIDRARRHRRRRGKR